MKLACIPKPSTLSEAVCLSYKHGLYALFQSASLLFGAIVGSIIMLAGVITRLVRDGVPAWAALFKLVCFAAIPLLPAAVEKLMDMFLL